MKAASGQSVAEVANTEGFTNSYFTLLLRIVTLSPCIVQRSLMGASRPRLPVSDR